MAQRRPSPPPAARSAAARAWKTRDNESHESSSFRCSKRIAQVSPETVLLLLFDAAGPDQLRPLFFILVDVVSIGLGRARRDFGAVERELLLHLIGAERVAQRLVEPVDHGTRRAGRRHQAVIQRGVKAGETGFG